MEREIKIFCVLPDTGLEIFMKCISRGVKTENATWRRISKEVEKKTWNESAWRFKRLSSHLNEKWIIDDDECCCDSECESTPLMNKFYWFKAMSGLNGLIIH